MRDGCGNRSRWQPSTLPQNDILPAHTILLHSANSGLVDCPDGPVGSIEYNATAIATAADKNTAGFHLPEDAGLCSIPVSS